MAARRIAVRCDGDEHVGAGHVARCLPVAAAFARRGWEPVLVGRFAGLGAWLLERSGLPAAPPAAGPAGVDPAGGWTAALVDRYDVPEAELCGLADVLPIATPGEARRCPDAGVLIDYHLDRAGEAPTERLLPGPAYAPIDPAFAAARRPRPDVGRVLVTVGGSAPARALVPALVSAAIAAFPGVRVAVASGTPPPHPAVDRLPDPVALVDVVGDVDLAVSGAGLTAYELACAGVPAVVVALADNQRRVVRACTEAGVAVGLDAVDGVDEGALGRAVGALRDPELRARLAVAGPAVLDGMGADRVAAALERRWTPGSAGDGR